MIDLRRSRATMSATAAPIAARTAATLAHPADVVASRANRFIRANRTAPRAMSPSARRCAFAPELGMGGRLGGRLLRLPEEDGLDVVAFAKGRCFAMVRSPVIA